MTLKVSRKKGEKVDMSFFCPPSVTARECFMMELARVAWAPGKEGSQLC